MAKKFQTPTNSFVFKVVYLKGLIKKAFVGGASYYFFSKLQRRLHITLLELKYKLPNWKNGWKMAVWTQWNGIMI